MDSGFFQFLGCVTFVALAVGSIFGFVYIIVTTIENAGKIKFLGERVTELEEIENGSD